MAGLPVSGFPDSGFSYLGERQPRAETDPVMGTLPAPRQEHEHQRHSHHLGPRGNYRQVLMQEIFCALNRCLCWRPRVFVFFETPQFNRLGEGLRNLRPWGLDQISMLRNLTIWGFICFGRMEKFLPLSYLYLRNLANGHKQNTTPNVFFGHCNVEFFC